MKTARRPEGRQRLREELPRLKPKHVKTLYKLFRKADKDQSGEISVLNSRCSSTIDVFAKAFTHMDATTREIDFPEFVKAAWAFVSLSKEGCTMFSSMTCTIRVHHLPEVGTVHEPMGQWRRSRPAKPQRTGHAQASCLVLVRRLRADAPALLFPAFQLQGR